MFVYPSCRAPGGEVDAPSLHACAALLIERPDEVRHEHLHEGVVGDVVGVEGQLVQLPRLAAGAPPPAVAPLAGMVFHRREGLVQAFEVFPWGAVVDEHTLVAVLAAACLLHCQLQVSHVGHQPELHPAVLSPDVLACRYCHTSFVSCYIPRGMAFYFPWLIGFRLSWPTCGRGLCCPRTLPEGSYPTPFVFAPEYFNILIF